MNNVDTNPAKDFSDPISLISLLGFFLHSHFSAARALSLPGWGMPSPALFS